MLSWFLSLSTQSVFTNILHWRSVGGWIGRRVKPCSTAWGLECGVKMSHHSPTGRTGLRLYELSVHVRWIHGRRAFGFAKPWASVLHLCLSEIQVCGLEHRSPGMVQVRVLWARSVQGLKHLQSFSRVSDLKEYCAVASSITNSHFLNLCSKPRIFVNETLL